MEDILLFFRGLGGLIVLLFTGYFVGYALFKIRLESYYPNIVFKMVIAFIFLCIIAGIIGIVLELSNI
jgi:hypothetical protein